MPGTSSLFDLILNLLANPALAQSFLSDPDGTFDGIDLNQTDINVVVAEINNSAALLNSSGVASIAIPALLPGMTAGELLDSFVTSFYADHPVENNVWTEDDVTQAFAGAGGIAVSAGEEAEDMTLATAARLPSAVRSKRAASPTAAASPRAATSSSRRTTTSSSATATSASSARTTLSSGATSSTSTSQKRSTSPPTAR